MLKKIKIALMGNPNSGKTSLLNSLAGLKMHVGNWPGKTVERKEAKIKFLNNELEITDLPGTYSLSSFSEEEKIAGRFVIKDNPEVIIQIIDVTSLEKSLFLFFEILALKKKIVLALNFNQEGENKGIKINIGKLTKILGVPIIKIEANTGKNKKILLESVIQVQKNKLNYPSYLKNILNKDKKISHSRAIKFIKEKVYSAYSNKNQNQQSRKIDRIILNKFTAFPIFLASMYLLFKITFIVSSPITDGIEKVVNWFSLLATNYFSGWLASFLSQGILGGVGSVLSFIPLIFILFFLIAIIEDSGYLARIIVLLDRLFAKLGVSGRSFIPMILGFGCNVPAILATRTIKNKRERMIAIFINPFMSCSARLAVYVLFTAVFFSGKEMYVIMFLYSLGIITALTATLILSKLVPDKKKDVLIIELPSYRWPTFKNVFNRAWWQTSLFIKKAGTIIFLAIIVVWVLASLPLGASYGSASSWLGTIGQWVAPIFKPLGFGNWIFAVALIFGLVAKEAIIGALGTLTGANGAGLLLTLPHFISPLGALSFLVFVSLYMPCLATIGAIKAETNQWRFIIIQTITSIAVAWFFAGVVFYVGGFLIN